MVNEGDRLVKLFQSSGEAWAAFAKSIGLDEVIDPIKTMGDAMELVTIGDILQAFPGGFVVGPAGGLWRVAGPTGFNQETGQGTLVVNKVF